MLLINSVDYQKVFVEFWIKWDVLITVEQFIN